MDIVILGFKDFFGNWKNFSGRTSRLDYWMVAIVFLNIGLFGQVLSTKIEEVVLIMGLINLVTFIPSLAMLCRRLNDAGKSKFNILLSFIPILGWAVLVWFLCLPSIDGDTTEEDIQSAIEDMPTENLARNEIDSPNEAIMSELSKLEDTESSVDSAA